MCPIYQENALRVLQHASVRNIQNMFIDMLSYMDRNRNDCRNSYMCVHVSVCVETTIFLWVMIHKHLQNTLIHSVTLCYVCVCVTLTKFSGA